MGHPLQSHYDKIPVVKCKGLCQEACGPLLLLKKEMEVIRKEFNTTLITDQTGSCNALCKATGTCKVYSARPWVCRAFGAMEGLECPHGCNTVPLVPQKEGDKLLKSIRKVGGGVVCTLSDK